MQRQDPPRQIKISEEWAQLRVGRTVRHGRAEVGQPDVNTRERGTDDFTRRVTSDAPIEDDFDIEWESVESDATEVIPEKQRALFQQAMIFSNNLHASGLPLQTRPTGLLPDCVCPKTFSWAWVGQHGVAACACEVRRSCSNFSASRTQARGFAATWWQSQRRDDSVHMVSHVAQRSVGKTETQCSEDNQSPDWHEGSWWWKHQLIPLNI